MTTRRESGQTAENHARDYLEQHGLKLVTQNWQCRRGELDLIMLDGNCLVFIEVRFRQHKAWGGALESVDERKRAKLILAAQQFLQSEVQWSKSACRFDVVAIEPSAAGQTAKLNWVKNAFDC